MTVLLVEDNAAVRRLLRYAVGDIASDIWECSDGADALAAYAKHSPDVVVMDVLMPCMDGLTATRHIRQFDPSARVVIVTDYDDEELRAAVSEVGACGYALKQNLPELASLIRSLAS
jgi:two-component system response regulator DegU